MRRYAWASAWCLVAALLWSGCGLVPDERAESAAVGWPQTPDAPAASGTGDRAAPSTAAGAPSTSAPSPGVPDQAGGLPDALTPSNSGSPLAVAPGREDPQMCTAMAMLIQASGVVEGSDLSRVRSEFETLSIAVPDILADVPDGRSLSERVGVALRALNAAVAAATSRTEVLRAILTVLPAHADTVSELLFRVQLQCPTKWRAEAEQFSLILKSQSQSGLTGSPYGVLDGWFVLPDRQVLLTGFAVDPDAGGPVSVRVLLDGAVVGTVPASLPRPDVDQLATDPSLGVERGFEWQGAVPAGGHRMCAQAVNRSAGSDVELGCADVVVP